MAMAWQIRGNKSAHVGILRVAMLRRLASTLGSAAARSRAGPSPATMAQTRSVGGLMVVSDS